MGKKLVIVVAVFIVLNASAAFAQNIAMNVRASTLGGGLEAEATLSEMFGVRAGVNYLTYDYDGTQDDIDYNIELGLESISLLLDWHPWAGAFRLSAGALFNGNEIETRAEPATSYTIGDTVYTPAQVGTLDGKIEFDDVSPYVSLGWDTSFGKNKTFGFIFELGAVYQGTPDVSLTANGTLASNPAFQSDLANEKKKVEDDLDNFEFYPVLALGLVYRY